MEDKELLDLFLTTGLRAVFDAGMRARQQAEKEAAELAQDRQQASPASDRSNTEPGDLLENLGLSEKTHNTLQREGKIISISQLTEMTRKGLLSIYMFGPTSLKEVEDALDRFGLQLRD